MGVTLITVTDPFGGGAAGQSVQAGPVAEPPSAARQPGGVVRSRIRTGGRLVTEQRIVSLQPVWVVRIELRSSPGYGGVTPVLEQLRVVADGRLVLDSAASASAPGVGSVVLGTPARTIRLRYVTSSVVRAPQPTQAGRVLVLANPLEVDLWAASLTEGGPVWLGGGDVLNAVCVSGDSTPQPCGRPVKGGWRVDLDGSAEVGVFAQVDLPTA